jgi:signal peptidase II
MADRFATGFVPDMIELLFVRFAIFNVADSFLCIGCALTAVSLLRRTQ